MKLTNRDIKIINFISENNGATIEQIQKLFFPSYDVAANRLKILKDNSFLKSQVHPILGKKVYYLKKVPSLHTLVITDVTIILKDEIKFMEREYKVKNNKVDCLFLLKTGKIIILEVDIFNRTKDKKIDEVMATLAETKTKIEFWIITKYKIQEKKKKTGVEYININNISEKLKSKT